MYKMSKFNHIVECDNKYIVYNFFSSSMVEMDKDFFEKFKKFDLNDKEIETIIELGFIEDKNSQMGQLNENYEITKNDNKNMNITVELTNACNLRCKYCYQEHNPSNLKKEQSLSLIKFIKNKAEDGLETLHIHWFGGEPTLNLKQAEYINEEVQKICESTGLKYNSSITTNGFDIIDQYDVLRKMNISNYQITLDGLKDTHDYSRPHLNGYGTFDNIIETVKFLTQKNEKVTIRYNVNKKNSNIKEFLDFLRKSKLNKDVLLHIQPTTDFELSEKIDNFYFKSNKEYSGVLKEIYYALLEEGYKVPKYISGGTNCPFDCSNNFMVTSDLEMLRCSSCDKTSESILGNIKDGKIIYDEKNYKEKMNTIAYDNEKCLNCKVLPICKGGCYLKRSLNMDECIPEVYFLDDYVKMLYKEEINVQD